MQIARYFGFRVEVDDNLPPYRLASLQIRAREIAERYELDPDKHHVYIHNLSFIPEKNTRLKHIPLHDRVDSVVIGFYVNEKQKLNKKLHFVNHLFRDILEPTHQYASGQMVEYTISGSTLERTFSNELITFIHHSLPERDRKIQVVITPRPAEGLKLRKKGRISTTKNLEYKRYTPIEIPSRALLGVSPAGSPKFIWRGPNVAEELHSFLQEDLLLVDMFDCRNAVERSGAVCRIEIPGGNHCGTGVLIGSRYVLTNFHVLERSTPGNADVRQAALETVLRFGAVADANGSETPGTLLKLDPDDPIPASSPTDVLDFVLLKLSEPAPDVFVPVPIGFTDLKVRDTLHLLQYPILQRSNNTMKLATKPNAITGIYPRLGRVQYITFAARGSSGSPCFNKDWNLVALHRAEQSTSFGSRREGILLSSIYELIKPSMEESNVKSHPVQFAPECISDGLTRHL